MPVAIKKIAEAITTNAINFLRKTKIGGFLFKQVLCSVMNSTQSVRHGHTHFNFVVPNQLNQFRIDTFSTKEPETLDWIDTFLVAQYLGILAQILHSIHVIRPR